MRKAKLIVVGCLLVLGVAGVSQANLIADPSFESGGSGSPWTGVNRWYDGSTLTWLPHGAGTWCAQVLTDDSPPEVTQTLSATYNANKVYDFSMWMTHDNGATATTRTIDIGYDPGTGFVSLASASGGGAARSWVQITGQYTTGASGSEIGKNIIVVLGNGSGGWTGWDDDAELIETPEPATMGLLALGGVGFLLRRRRR